MKVYSGAIQAHLAKRTGISTQLLIWITAKTRDAIPVPATIGFWTGDDHQVVSVDGLPRTYFGAGAVLGIEPFTSRAGLEVREIGIDLSPLVPELVQAINEYEPRLAGIEIHEWFFDPETNAPLDVPVRVFSGILTSVMLHTPEEGGEASCRISAASAAWRLTRALTTKRSNAALRARNPSDSFRAYSDVSGSVETVWGEVRAAAPSRKPAPKPVYVERKDHGR